MIIWLVLILFTFSISFSQFYTFQFNILPKQPIFIHYLQNIFESLNDLCIGEPILCRKTYFDPSTSVSYFLNSYNQSDPFQLSHSSSRVVYKASFMFSNEKMSSGILFEDKATLGNIKITNLSIFSPIDLLYFARNSSGIGLQIKRVPSVYSPFTNVLYSKEIISHFAYSIKYHDNKNGQVTFGKDPNLQAFYNKILETELYQASLNLPFIQADIITIGDSYILPSIIGEYKIGIDESFSFIQIPFEIQDDLLKTYNFLNQGCKQYKYKKEKSSFSNINITYYYYLCNKKLINGFYNQTFPDLNFHYGSEIISLNSEHLFSNYTNEDKIFNIILFECLEENQMKWIIGEPILKLYITEHDYSENIFKLYINRTKKKDIKLLLQYFLLSNIVILIFGLAITLFSTAIFNNQKNQN